MRQYPYIPDKNMYAAVKFACKMIREHEYFSRACYVAARYYKVNEQALARHVFMREPAEARCWLLRPVRYTCTGVLNSEQDKKETGVYGPVEIICASNYDSAFVFYIPEDAKKSHHIRLEYPYTAYAHEVIGSPEGYESLSAAQKAMEELS